MRLDKTVFCFSDAQCWCKISMQPFYMRACLIWITRTDNHAHFLYFKLPTKGQDDNNKSTTITTRIIINTNKEDLCWIKLGHHDAAGAAPQRGHQTVNVAVNMM